MESSRTLVHTPSEGDSGTAEQPVRAPGARRGGLVARRPRRAGRGFELTAGELLLDRYRMLAPLGRGGFGEVWQAHDELLHRDVAVKRIALGPEGDSERATREAHAAARLSHPAIVALYEALPVGPAFYLISELVDGDTLSVLMAADTLADEQLLAVGLELTGALAHAHARGVVHRDIKPQNVLVPHSGDGAAAKLTDFGGASLAGEQALTRTGDVLGTLAYMAPEQSEGLEAAPATDLYALALVLYEALSGINPVRGATPAATVRRIGHPLEPLERRRGDLPRELTRAIDRALAPDPRRRGELAELREALAEALERSPPRGHSVRGHVQLPPPRPTLDEDRGHANGEHAARDSEPPALVEPELEDPPAQRSRGVLPRALWLGCGLALVVWQAAAGRFGVALLALAAIVPLLALPRRAGPGWLAAALAPLLGLVGLAGVFPALAGQARSWRARTGLAVLAYWWLTLAEPLLARRLWLGPAHGTPARAAWEGSIGVTAAHVLAPVLTVGLVLGAALWALGALVLPWIVRGRNAAVDVVAAVSWTAAIASAAPLLDGGVGAAAHHANPRGVVFAAVLAALVAVATRALRGPV